MRAFLLSTLNVSDKLPSGGSVQTISVDEIATKFDEVIAMAQRSPVHVQGDGRDVAVVLAPELYELLIATPPKEVNATVAALFKRSIVDRAEVYRALARYEADHPEPKND